MTHWALSYIGLPWKAGADGPEAFDCWGFVATVSRDHFGRLLPDIPDRDFNARQAVIAIRDHEERANWSVVRIPREGDLVLCAKAKVEGHIGILAEANGQLGVLHCSTRFGVRFHSIPSLDTLGWGTLVFYRHRSEL